jgi:hypothetical protein
MQNSNQESLPDLPTIDATGNNTDLGISLFQKI